MLEERYLELKAAEKGAVISILAYILISTLKLTVGIWAHSAALKADGLNNFTDIIASLAVLIGLRLARRPADDDHRYGHWKVETVASMVTSFIMLLVGGQVLISSIKAFLNNKTTTPDPLAAYVGIFSALVMLGVYFYNRKLAQRVRSGALLAAAKDNLSDAYTSIGTSVAIFAASLNWHWLDTGAACVVGIIIIKTGLEVFSESAFSLSDGFSEDLLKTYSQEVMMVHGVRQVSDIRGRTYGANIFIDIVVLMDGNLSVDESHDITEHIEFILHEKYGVFDTDVHVEPYKESAF